MKPKQNELNANPPQITRHLRPLCLLPLLVVFAICAGCKQEAKVAPVAKTVAPAAADINPVGTYTLITVDGHKVPCTVQHEGHAMAIKSGTFIINADGTCSWFLRRCRCFGTCVLAAALLVFCQTYGHQKSDEGLRILVK